MGLVGLISRSRALVDKGKRFVGNGYSGVSEFILSRAARYPRVTGVVSGVLAYSIAYTSISIVGDALNSQVMNPEYYEILTPASLGIAVASGLLGYNSAYRERKFRDFQLDQVVLNEFTANFGNARRAAPHGLWGLIGKHKIMFSVMSAAAVELGVILLTGAYVLMSLYMRGEVLPLDAIPTFVDYLLKGTIVKTVEEQPLRPLIMALAAYSLANIFTTGGTGPNLSYSFKYAFGSLLAKLTRKAVHVVSPVENEVNHNPSKYLRFELANLHFVSGNIDGGLEQLKIIIDGSEPWGMKGGPIILYIKELVGDSYSKIRNGSATQADYMALASSCSFIGAKDKAEEIVARMVEKFKTPEDYWLAALFSHRAGNTAARNRYMATLIPMLYADPVKFRREPLGEDPSHDVFDIAHPLLRNHFVLKLSHDLESLEYESGKIGEVLSAIQGYNEYPAVEPLLVHPLNGNAVYVATRMPGETLLYYLLSGEAGLDDMLAAWNLGHIIHNSPKVTKAGLKHYTVSERLRVSLSKDYLNLPDRAKTALLQGAAQVDYHLEGSPSVIFLDLHPENIIVSISGTKRRMSIIDIENKGLAPPEVDAANLFRYVQAPQLDEAKEAEFLKIAGIDPLRYYNAALYRAVALSLAWMNPGRPRMNSRVSQKIKDGIDAVEQIKNTIPLSYPGFRHDYEAAVSGLQELERLVRVAA